MNIYTVTILSFLLLQYFLNLVANLLNLKSLRQGLPQELKGLYDEPTYQKSQEYTYANTQLELVSGTFNLFILLAFWSLGGFNRLDLWVRSFNLPELSSGLIYIGLLVIVSFLGNLPFSLYKTFVIEEKYGFNQTTPLTFVSDLCKSLFLTVLLGGPLLAAVMAFFRYAGEWAWFYCWITVSVFSVFLQLVAPTLIMPLFNKFTPLPNSDLKQAINDFAQSVEFPLEGIYMIDGSKRSSKANAFFSGFGKFKRIALFDTLIQQLSTSELVAVLAHEIGHYQKKHIQKNLLIGILQSGLMFYLLSVFIRSEALFQAFGVENNSIYAGLVFFGLFFSAFDFILTILLQMLSRKHEFEADAFAAQTTQQPESLIESLKKLSVNNLTHLTPHPLYVFLNYSHPPLLERIKALNSLKTAEPS